MAMPEIIGTYRKGKPKGPMLVIRDCHKPAEHQICEMIDLHNEAEELQDFQIWFLAGRPFDEDHEPHTFSVLNRTFFCNAQGGTVLITNDGFLRTAEGDFLFMKPGCPHHSELQTPENAHEDRLVVTAFKFLQ